MVRSGVFYHEEFPKLPDERLEQMQLILNDLIQGGYMGLKEKDERIESGMEYNRLLMQAEMEARQTARQREAMRSRATLREG